MITNECLDVQSAVPLIIAYSSLQLQGLSVIMGGEHPSKSINIHQHSSESHSFSYVFIPIQPGSAWPRGFPGYTLTAVGECEMKGEGFFVAIGVVGAGDSKGYLLVIYWWLHGILWVLDGFRGFCRMFFFLYELNDDLVWFHQISWEFMVIYP